MRAFEKYFDLEEINPQNYVGPPKYSLKLYRWLKRKNNYSKIYLGTHNLITGVDVFKPQIFVGQMFDDGWFYGNRIKNIAIRKNYDSFAYSPMFDTKNWEDISDDFWPEYLRIGFCAFTESRHQYVQLSPRVRECAICKKRQKLKAEMVKKEVWHD